MTRENRNLAKIIDSNHAETKSLTANFKEEMQQFKQNLKQENSIWK
jgi:hypothetical protein